MHAAGGADAFLEDHAVIVCSDHSQSLVEDEIDLFRAFDGFDVLSAERRPASAGGTPRSRSARARARRRSTCSTATRRRDAAAARSCARCSRSTGVDLVMHLTDHPDGEAAVRSHRGELRFAPRGDLTDLRGDSWSVEGDLDVLALDVARRPRHARDRYPDALGRVWSALRCRTAGEVLASAAPGWEFLDWGRSHHIGGGSHGSLHANDSHGSLLWCGTGPDSTDVREQWTLRDIVPMVLRALRSRPSRAPERQRRGTHRAVRSSRYAPSARAAARRLRSTPPAVAAGSAPR